MDGSTPEHREGFQLRAIKLIPPSDMAALDPQTRRELMICDLFLNEKLTISEIIGVFDEENYRSVVQALIKRGALLDRRKQQRL
jgi:hypothetical protein